MLQKDKTDFIINIKDSLKRIFKLDKLISYKKLNISTSNYSI